MPTKPEKSPEQLAFEAAQAAIRACVQTPDGVVFTWFRDGRVVRWSRFVDAYAEEHAVSIEAFNSLIRRYGVAGLQGRDALKSKRPERLAP